MVYQTIMKLKVLNHCIGSYKNQCVYIQWRYFLAAQRTVDNVMIDNYEIPKHTTIVMPGIYLQRSEKYFGENSYQFDFMRFKDGHPNL